LSLFESTPKALRITLAASLMIVLAGCGGAPPSTLSVSLGYTTKSSYSVWEKISIKPEISGLQGQTATCKEQTSYTLNTVNSGNSGSGVPSLLGGVGSAYSPSLVTVSGIPPGFNLNPTTCEISGQATSPGSYAAKVTVIVNGYEGGVSGEIKFLVNGPSADYPMTLGANGQALLQWADAIPSINTTPNILGIDPAQDTVSFVAGGALPEGVALNASTGVLSGTPARSGSFVPSINMSVQRGGKKITVGTKPATFIVEAPTLSYPAISLSFSDLNSFSTPSWTGLRPSDVINSYTNTFPVLSNGCYGTFSSPAGGSFSINRATGAARPVTPIANAYFCTGVIARVVRNGIEQAIIGETRVEMR
jgi:Putative Ig domain